MTARSPCAAAAAPSDRSMHGRASSTTGSKPDHLPCRRWPRRWKATPPRSFPAVQQPTSKPREARHRAGRYPSRFTAARQRGSSLAKESPGAMPRPVKMKAAGEPLAERHGRDGDLLLGPAELGQSQRAPPPLRDETCEVMWSRKPALRRFGLAHRASMRSKAGLAMIWKQQSSFDSRPDPSRRRRLVRSRI